MITKNTMLSAFLIIFFTLSTESEAQIGGDELFSPTQKLISRINEDLTLDSTHKVKVLMKLREAANDQNYQSKLGIASEQGALYKDRESFFESYKILEEHLSQLLKRFLVIQNQSSFNNVAFGWMKTWRNKFYERKLTLDNITASGAFFGTKEKIIRACVVLPISFRTF